MSKKVRGSVVFLGLAFAAACSSSGGDLDTTPSPTPVDTGRRDAGVSPSTDAGAQPLVDSSTPVIDSGAPAVDSSAPVIDSSVPVIDSGTPVIDSSVPVIDSGTPVIDSGTPVVDSGAPVVDSGAPVVDSGAPVVDSGTPVVDAGRDAGPLVCAPPNTTPAYTPGITWPASAAWGQNRCTAATVQGFLDACLGAASTLATCNAWKNANATCSACLITSRNAAAIGPFVTNPAVTPDNNNPPGLDGEWVEGLLSGCLNHFRAGCGPSYFSFANCLDTACNPTGNCSAASSSTRDTCVDDAIGAGQGVCGSVALAALGQNGTCRGVFPLDAGTTLSGNDCFARGASRGEDTTTQVGIDAFLKRIALYTCGP